MKKQIFALLALWVAVACVTGCRTKPVEVPYKPAYDRPLAPGQWALRKITDPYEIPNLTSACANVKDLREAVGNSLNYLGKPSSRRFFPCNGISHSKAVESLQEFAGLLDSGLTGSVLDAAIREKFDFYMSVGCDDNGTVLFTGYYTPIFTGSTTRSGEFQYPLFKQPANMVKGPNGEILGRRMRDGQVIPYPPRAVIEDARLFEGGELVWLGDPFETYISHVQGSAKIKLPDGKLMGVGYAANNGHEYHSISQEMVKDGRISASQLSLTAMIEYFKRHRDQVAMYVRRNPRFVFFKKEDGPPRGSLNEPVIKMRTIATDKAIFPRGSLTLLSTNLPQQAGGVVSSRPYSEFAMDQDTGGAIRAAGRCDVYMGEGDMAGRLAGQTYKEGRLYYLFLK